MGNASGAKFNLYYADKMCRWLPWITGKTSQMDPFARFFF